MRPRWRRGRREMEAPGRWTLCTKDRGVVRLQSRRSDQARTSPAGHVSCAQALVAPPHPTLQQRPFPPSAFHCYEEEAASPLPSFPSTTSLT